MDHEQFTNVFDAQVKRSRDILIEKAKQYATDSDRLANFKAVAALQGISPQAALAGMMAKHSYSVYAMAHSSEEFTLEQWDEKITDHVNYLILLRAVLEEERSNRSVEIYLDRSYEDHQLDREFAVEPIVLSTRNQAQILLGQLNIRLNKHGAVRVDELYLLVNLPNESSMNAQFGWTTLLPSHIVGVDNDNFQLMLPPPQFIQ